MSEETALSPIGALDPEQFALALDDESKRQALMEDYIKKNLVEGRDYGSVGQGKKPSLWKPGAEKVALLVHARPEFDVDKDTMDALGLAGSGHFVFKCRLLSRGGVLIGEGRGASINSDTKKDLNTHVKMVKKRAFVDAVLTAAALSDRFTQDMEDLGENEGPPPRASAPARQSARAPRTSTKKAPPAAGLSGVTLPFGKHKGKDLAEVDDGYLAWMADNPLDESGKYGEKNAALNAAVGAELERRAAPVGAVPVSAEEADELDLNDIPF